LGSPRDEASFVASPSRSSSGLRTMRVWSYAPKCKLPGSLSEQHSDVK
jgi:hypothetical protein